MNEHKALPHKGGFGRKIRGYFFTGLLVLIPVVLTGWIIWKLFLAIDGILRPYVHPFLADRFGIELLGETQIPGIGFITLTLTIIATGAMLVLFTGFFPFTFRDVLLVTIIGLAAQIFDSILGASLQSKYRCLRCEKTCEQNEHCAGAGTELISGWKRMNNDAVNWISTVFSTFVGWLVY